MKKNTLDLSIVISTFNTKGLLKKTLLSVYRTFKDITFEIIVVDDASGDGSADMVRKYFPKANVITNKNNLGYSKSYNLGTKISNGKYILHLNSDVQFLGNLSFNEIISFMKSRPDVGIAGCKVLKSNGSLDLPCRRSFPTPINIFFQTIGLAKMFPKNKYFGNYYLTYLDDNKITEIDCIMGAFMLIKRDLFKKIGYLDEIFFIYGEDIDFCYRAKNAGWKIVYFPKIKIKHLHGGTTNNFRLRYIWHFHYSMFQYYNKHYLKKNLFPLHIIVYTGIILRLALVLFVNLLNLNSIIYIKKMYAYIGVHIFSYSIFPKF